MGPCSTTLRLAPAILIASLSGLASDGHDDNAPDGFGHVITFKPDCLQSHYQVRALTRKPDGTICREIGPIDLTIHRAMPRSVAFGGDNHTIHHDATGHAYDAPHWLDFDRDGQITAPPQSPPGATGVDRRFPIAYTRNTPMTIAAFETHFSKDAFGAIPQPQDYTIVGTGSDGSIYTSAPTIPYAPFTGSPLPNHIAYLPNYSISWEISFDGEYLWYNLGTTTHEVYVTLTEPGGQRLDSMYHIATSAAADMTDLPSAVNATWNRFASRSVHNSHGDRLGYYRNGPCDEAADPDYIPGGELDPYVISARRLLVVTNGQCGSWADLFQACLRIHGAENISFVEVAPHTPALPSCSTQASGFLVNNYSFILRDQSPCTTYPYRYNHGCDSPFASWPETDVLDQVGLPGQDSPNPASLFSVHYVIPYNLSTFDPSYGSGPHNSNPAPPHPGTIQSWANSAIAGFLALYVDITGAAGITVRQREPDSADMRFRVFAVPTQE